MYAPRFKVSRCAIAYVTVTPAGGNMAQASLFNNSTGRDYLVVRDWQHDNRSQTQPSVILSLLQGTQGSLFGTGQPILTGEATPSGQIYTATPAALPTGHYIAYANDFDAPPWTHDYPIAVLRPGWSFVLTGLDVSTTPSAFSFYWQMCWAEELEHYDGL